jgi:Flp pilus assembly protein TadD
MLTASVRGSPSFGDTMKAKILYIEDNEQSLYLVTFLLKSNSYEVLQARNGIEGIEAAVKFRPDQWTSHYNIGNYQLGRGETKKAVASYQVALKLDPKAIMPMVNTAIAYAQMGENDKAERSLQKSLKQAPDNSAANFNMGLLKVEKEDFQAAEKYLKIAFESDPQMAQSAYNLCIITAKDRISEAVTWCRKASDLRPQEPKYSYTLAFYLDQKGERAEAVRILKALIEKHPGYKDTEMLLGELERKP